MSIRLTIAFWRSLSPSSGGGACREPGYSQLHLVPWHIGAGLCDGAALAGQRASISRNQLRILRPHPRQSIVKQYMWGARRSLGAQTARDLAMYFSTLPRKAAVMGTPRSRGDGKTIYQEGMPDSNIVACVVCHGPNAEGVSQIPRFGGLAYSYLTRRLEQWNEGYNAAAGPPMPSIASKLSPNQIAALASYLSFVK